MLDVGGADGIRIGEAAGGLEPVLGHEPDDLLDDGLGDERGEPLVGRRDRLGDGGEHVAAGVERLADEAADVRRPARPRVVEPQGGAVVDRPRPPVPDEEVGVGPGAVDVGGVRVEPQDRAGVLGGGRT